MEIFKEIKDYPDYQVSNYGNVKSLKFNKERLLKPMKLKNGYAKIDIWTKNVKKQLYVHRLVASTFIRNINEKEQIDHIDKNKLNNKLNNLEIVSCRLNNLRKKEANLAGAHKYKNDKWKSSVVINGKGVFIGLFNTELEAHEAYKNKLKEYGINIDFNQDLVCMLDDNKI